MLTIEEALGLVLKHAGRKAPCRVPLHEALGLALAEEVASDVDTPPHDRSIVDGYAVVATDLSAGRADLIVLEEVTAGATPTKPVTGGHCTRIMTGAPIPAGADAVVMIERTELLPNSPRVRILSEVKAGQNIMGRGASVRRGEVVLRTGDEIRPAEVGLLAEVGRTEVQVFPRPRLAIVSTGNELVEVHAQPAASQIRNSNGPMLAAAARRAGAIPLPLGIARDETADLRTKIQQGLGADILVLSGGVSAGVLDLVPGVLRDLGIEQVFHKVSLKPGKPLWFGVQSPKSKVKSQRLPEHDLRPWTLNGGPCLVFGLPGNPVSSLVCFELFVRPAIAELAGRDSSAGLRRLPARLARDFEHRGERPTYFPAAVERQGDLLCANTVRWRGSGDLRALVHANALAIFDAGERHWRAGEAIDVLLF